MDSFEQPPIKRKSSILKLNDKKRDSRTVSFSEKFMFKELHPDGTFDVTNMFLQQDMDLTFIENTLNVVTDMSMDLSLFTRYSLELSSSTLKEEEMIDDHSLVLEDTKFVYDTKEESESMLEEPSNDVTIANETLYGAFHDSNNLSSTSSCNDQMYQNIEALDDCIQKIDQEVEENVRNLDEEMQELFKWYRHIINKDNKYEFAVKIFGLRYGLWLIIKIDPETYPNQKLSLNFAVNKRDRHLYPFPEYAEAVKRFTKEGRPGYLTRFIFSAQKFRRFLRKSGFAQKDKYHSNKN